MRAKNSKISNSINLRHGYTEWGKRTRKNAHVRTYNAPASISSNERSNEDIVSDHSRGNTSTDLPDEEILFYEPPLNPIKVSVGACTPKSITRSNVNTRKSREDDEAKFAKTLINLLIEHSANSKPVINKKKCRNYGSRNSDIPNNKVGTICVNDLSKKVSIVTLKEEKENTESEKNSNSTQYNELKTKNEIKITPEKTIQPTCTNDPLEEAVLSIKKRLSQITNDGSKSIDPVDDRLFDMMTSKLLPAFVTHDSTLLQKTPGKDSKRLFTKTLKAPIKEKQIVHLFGSSYHVLKLVGKGAYARVYHVRNDDGDYALKVQTPPCLWEYYILQQIHRRVPESMKKRFIPSYRLHFNKDCSFILMKFGKSGSLQDIINMYRSKENGRGIDEIICLFYTIELMKILRTLHQDSQIVHADLKTDNVLIISEDTLELDENEIIEGAGLQLLDFGQSIDLTLFPKNQQFHGESQASGFRSESILNGKKWRTEVDLYGLGGIIYCMLFGKYLQTNKRGGRYKMREKCKRYWQQDLWYGLMDILLNESFINWDEWIEKFKNFFLKNPDKHKQLKNKLREQAYKFKDYRKTIKIK